MKQLLQHLKEVTEKANPEYWTPERINIYFSLKVPNGSAGITKRGLQTVIRKYQKEQLKLEGLLYGHWERTYQKGWKMTLAAVSDDKKSLVDFNKLPSFNEWIENELSKL